MQALAGPDVLQGLARHRHVICRHVQGQEVARWFFRVGGAAGTIAKSISAYDMTISDTTYGACKR